MDIEALIRPNIRKLKPYRSARQDYTSGILLDANENAFGSAVTFDGLELNRYPDPSQRELRTKIALLQKVETDNIFVGVGSDEVIDLLIRIFCEPRTDSVLILEPTYGVYRVAADVNDVKVRSCLLTDDFQIDLDEVRRHTDTSTKLIFCCSPTNPTGNLLRREDILALCATTSAIVVVDEAYFVSGEPGCLGIAERTGERYLKRLARVLGTLGRGTRCIVGVGVLRFQLRVEVVDLFRGVVFEIEA